MSHQTENKKCNCGYGNGIAHWHSPKCAIFGHQQNQEKCKHEEMGIVRDSKVGARAYCKQCGEEAKNQESWTPRNKTHGLSYGKFYRTFHHMRNRCNNLKAPNYHKYGGKGIKCLWANFEEFKLDMYEDFLEHVGKHGEANTTIDRIDSAGDYCKKNCRWATYQVQNNNRDVSNQHRFVEINGRTLNIEQWVRELGLKSSTVWTRICQYGWSPLEALTIPIGKNGVRVRSRKNKTNE